MALSSMQDIKRRKKSVRSIEHVTNAMKLVSSAKLRRAKSNFEKTSRNFLYIIESIESIFNNAGEVPKQYLSSDRGAEKTGYIIVSSNRGLCGSFNSTIMKLAESSIKAEGTESVIFAIGSKGRDYFKKRGYTIQSEYIAPPENISFLETSRISKPIIEMYNRGEIDKIVLIYTSYISTLEQKAKSVTLLPFDISENPEVEKNVRDVEYEPSVEAVFNYLVPKYVELQIHGAIIESATCEHAARRMAMENATDNAQEMLQNLSLIYNRARQAAITNEIIEIVAGAEAQK